MKVINPNNTEHRIELIPRFYPTSLFFEVDIYDEVTRVSQTKTDIDFNIVKGVMILVFEFSEFNEIDFIENGTYQLKITDSDNIVYRGKILVTSQESQDYKLTKGIYE